MTTHPWLELAGVVALMLMGAAAGVRSARLARARWLSLYLAMLAFVFAVGLARRSPQAAFTPPFDLLVEGRTDYLLLAAAFPFLFGALVARLENRRLGRLLAALGVVVLAQFCLMPYAQPLWLRDRFTRLMTQIDTDGVCLQSEYYTCGPAAAVTLLRKLGLPADEGPLAIAARTCAVVGTPPDELASTLTALYAPRVTARHRLFADVDELAGALPAIAVIEYLFMVDHYVAVLEVGPREVVVGDPLHGKRRLSREDFARVWRRNAVVLVPTSPAASSAGLEVRFLVDDEVLIHELCNHGPMAVSDPGLAQAVVQAQARIWSMTGEPYELLRGSWFPAIFRADKDRGAPAGLSRFLERVRSSAEYRDLRKQTVDRMRRCDRQWTADRDRSESFVRDLTGLAIEGPYRVVVLPPAMAAAQNVGNRVLKWGGHDDGGHSTSVHVWHEVLHDHLPNDDLAHVLIQLVADHELRMHLDPDTGRAGYIGHARLKDLSARVLPYWRAYRSRSQRSLTALYAELRRLDLK